MDTVFIYFISFIIMVKPYHLDYEDSDYENYNDGSFAKTLPDSKTTKETNPTTRTTSRYEVTENVVDIPDNRTLGPIVANYSISKPLNTAPPTTATTQANEGVTVTNKNNKVKKNYINLLHINAEYDKPDEIQIPLENTNSHVNDVKVNEYLNGIKEVLVNGFNRVVNKHRFTLRDIVSAPLMFLKNLQKKGNDVADQLHKAILGNQL